MPNSMERTVLLTFNSNFNDCQIRSLSGPSGTILVSPLFRFQVPSVDRIHMLGASYLNGKLNSILVYFFQIYIGYHTHITQLFRIPLFLQEMDFQNLSIGIVGFNHDTVPVKVGSNLPHIYHDYQGEPLDINMGVRGLGWV